MRHPKLIAFERRMKKMFDAIDDHLEDKYGGRFDLRPSRPFRGTTSNKQHDGLFNVGVKFSAGFGSKYGKGYVVDVEMSTLEHVPEHVKDDIYLTVAELIQEKLPYYFPERNLHIEKDGGSYKITGDFSLGHV